MSKEFKTALVKALKELLRITIIGSAANIAVALEAGDVDYRFIALTVLIAFLKGLDKLAHEYGNETGNESIKLGITRF